MPAPSSALLLLSALVGFCLTMGVLCFAVAAVYFTWRGFRYLSKSVQRHLNR